MNIKEYLSYATDSLKNANIETPALEAGVMLCHALKCDRAYLYAHDDRLLEKEELEVLSNMLVQRATNNVPLQYIIGETEFMSLSFIVNPAVLIPRQDTEILVEKCIELVNGMSVSEQMNRENETKTIAVDKCTSNGKNVLKVLDMCTGSGCIAISIAHYCPNSRVVACDVSRDALSIARTNSERNEVQDRLELRCGNLFEALEGEQQFNIIVSNPPYIETDTISELQKEVKNHEPNLALDGGQDGLDFYRRIITLAPDYLTNGGYLAFEIGYNQGQSVKALMHQYFYDIEVYKDLSGNDRVVIGRLNK